MTKKIILACMAVVAFAAFVVPASASAAANEPVLTEEGVRVAHATPGTPGPKIRAHLVGSSLLQETGGTTLFTCNSGEMTGEVTENTGGTVEGKITFAHFTGTGNGNDCTGSFAVLGVQTKVTTLVSEANPWCLSSTPLMLADEFQVTKCGGGKITFILDVTGVGECKYEATGAIKGTYTTETTGDAILTVTSTSAASGFTLESGSAGACKTSGKLNMAFTLETDVEGTHPLTISDETP